MLVIVLVGNMYMGVDYFIFFIFILFESVYYKRLKI